MKILICGAQGFVGRHLQQALTQAGHTIIGGVRTVKNDSEIAIDFSQDSDAALWETRLRSLGDIDFVINAVGILNESTSAKFAQIHSATPKALFDAAARCNARGIVQISALGGTEEHGIHPDSTPYMRTKREADAHLQQMHCSYLIVRPSLIVGLDGASSRLFRCLASLPLIGLPGDGQQKNQAVHVDDICQLVLNWINLHSRKSVVINAVGPQILTYRGMLNQYRNAMNLPKQIQLPIPIVLIRWVAKIATLLPQKVLSPDTVRMLEKDNVADISAFSEQLGHPPRAPQHWFTGVPPNMLLAEAQHSWCMPLLKCSLALVWVITGLLSLGIYPVQSSLNLLTALDIHGKTALALLYAAACSDLLLGFATLYKPSRNLWLVQILLITLYSILISLYLPEYCLHPFGPILKNLPILAILFMLLAQEKKS